MTREVRRKPCILVLPGITQADLEEDNDKIFSSRFMENAEFASDPVQKDHNYYSEPPREFVSLDTWPKSTNIPCWNCDIQFAGRPWPIVDYFFCDRDGNRRIRTKGCFHSANCAMAYINNEYTNDQERDDKIRGLLYIYKKFTGKNINIIKPAYSKTEMKKYKGPNGWTVDEYIRKNEELNIDNPFGPSSDFYDVV